MPPLPLLGSLLGMASSAGQSIFGAGSDDTSATTPFSQTLQQSMKTQAAAQTPPSAAPQSPGEAPGTSSNAANTASAGQSTQSDASNTGASAQSTTNSTGQSGSHAAQNSPPHAASDSAQDTRDAAAAAAAASVQAQLQLRVEAAAHNAQQGLANGASASDATSVQSAALDAGGGVSGSGGLAALPEAVRTALDKLGASGTSTVSGTSSSAHALSASASRDAARADTGSTSQDGAATSSGDDRGFGKTFSAASRTLSDSATFAAQNAQTVQNAASRLADDGGTASGVSANAGSASPATTADPAALASAAASSAATQGSAGAASSLGASSTAQSLAAPVGTPAWEQELSQKVVFFTGAHQTSAELTLNPPGLGPLQVSVRLADDGAHAQFVSQHAQVRDAVEAALPQLREAFKASGITLGSTSVSDNAFASAQQNPQQQSTGGEAQAGARNAMASGTSGAAATIAASSATASALAASTQNSLIDTFA